ncbi:MAG TPA: hypothetical protein VK760_03485 [Candidatus Acidoferrales bacterium]|nr:hypothetical protein [Candidatus Acidoferrales bacterium]
MLNAASSGPAVSADAYGAELATWYDFTQPFVNPSLAAANVHLIRFPGGSESDLYHWENGALCDPNQGYVLPRATFDNLMKRVAAPLKTDVAITLNYGSNRACDGGGDPTEAAAWVAYSKRHGYNARFWTVGNEVYGSWEYDLHPKPHDPVTYSNAVRTGFYPAVKAADPSAQLGVVVDTPDDRTWNDVVLKQSQPFDFVELHYYPQYVHDSDGFLLGDAITNFVSDLAGLRKQMNAAGVAASVPIYLGEFNNDAGQEGKQSVSIVNGLFYGQMLGSLLNAGVPRATWWLAYGSCDEKGDYSKSLYGWQHFGSEAMFSDGLPSAAESCPNAPHIPAGTAFPSARALALFSQTAPAGSNVRKVTEQASLGTRVRAYGFSTGRGYAMILFNNTLAPIAVTARIEGAGRTAFRAELATYGKAQYDESKQNRWAGPLTQELGSVSSSVPLTLPPYSVTALTLR